MVVLQTEELNHLSTTIAIPLSTRPHHAGSATAVHLPAAATGLKEDSYALCQHLRVLDQKKLRGQVGQVSPVQMSEIEATVAFILGLS